ncbi:hypothetical protein [Microbispora sp. NBC_01389]|uniref:hypothetical protein n=1 Tax=Microbispora sp. NBC_01389 TaxID=2903584 RepID=UPI003243B96F
MARSHGEARGGRRRDPLLARFRAVVAGLLAGLLTGLLAGPLTGAAVTQALFAVPAAAAGRPAEDPPGGRGPATVGNGTRNRNVVFLDSPSRSRGHQHTSASTAGGATSVEDGFCRRVTNCSIRQNLTVVIGAADS